jgi:hypothetical protein
MKLNSQAFPYPVLTSDDGHGADYKTSGFQCSLGFSSEVNPESKKFNIEYAFSLTNDEINKLIEDGDAGFAIDINCPNTLKRDLCFLEQAGSIEINASELYGKVEFTPMIIIRKANINFSSPDLNDEFDGATFVLNSGDIIAMDDTWNKYIEFNNLFFDTLVKVDTDDTLAPFDYKIEPTPSFIYIWMGTAMRALWQEMRRSKNLKPALAMSVYKDVVFIAIEDLIENSDADSQQWARALRSKIEALGYELPKDREFNKINIIAQQMVQDAGASQFSKVLGDP